MSGYAKLFSEIVDSSIWDEDSDTCKVWITLLALADQDGYVRGSEGWLAGKSRVSIGKCVLALRKFKEPDLRSRTPDNEGRRIEQLEDGWLVLNYIAFRERLSNDPTAVATRERVRKHRERYTALRNATTVTPCYTASASASSVQEGVQGKPTMQEVLGKAQLIGLAPWKAEDWYHEMTGSGWLDHLKRPIANWQAVLTRVKTKWESDGRPMGPPKSPGYQQQPNKQKPLTPPI